MVDASTSLAASKDLSRWSAKFPLTNAFVLESVRGLAAAPSNDLIRSSHARTL
jgi:hypothetical protein